MRYNEEPIKKPLPQNKQEELKKITDIILKEGKDIEMIILFGSYARGNWRDAKDYNVLDPRSRRVSDYDLLIVTKSKKIAKDSIFWQDVQEKCNQFQPSAPAKLMAHDIYDINDKLEIGQYFYKDIKKEGKILYNSGNFELAHEKPINKQRRQKIIRDHYQELFEGAAKEFYRNYEFNFKEKYYKRAAFMLHQTTEAAYQISLFIFTNYIPNEHYLCTLANIAAKKVDKRLKEVFPKKSDKNYKIFEMLDYAYIGGRYDVRFKVTKEELEYIAPLVKKLLDIVQEICLKEINSF